MSEVSKNALQEIFQRAGITELPSYSTVAQGPAHAPTFVSSVSHSTWTGIITGAPCRTARDAEKDAAACALRMLPRSSPPASELTANAAADRNAKNDLQEFFQRSGILELPQYCTQMYGPAHAASFVSTVSHSSWTAPFIGAACRTARDAEKDAAACALRALPPPPPPPSRWLNPEPSCALRAILIDMENQSAAARFLPQHGDYVVGFAHNKGMLAARAAEALFDVSVLPLEDCPDAADVAMVWHLASLVLRRGLPARTPVLLVSNDHIFETLSRVLAVIEPDLHVQLCYWEPLRGEIVARGGGVL